MAEFKLPILSSWLSNYSRLTVGDTIISPKFSRRYASDYQDNKLLKQFTTKGLDVADKRELESEIFSYSFNSYAFTVLNLSRRIRYHVYGMIEEWHPEVSVALDTIADEICIRGLNNEVFDLIIKKKNGEVPTEEEKNYMAAFKTILDTFLFDTLDISKRAWSWARNLVKFGDWFVEPILGTTGIVDIRPFYDPYNIIKVELPNNFAYYLYNKEQDLASGGDTSAMMMARDYPSAMIWQPAVVQTFGIKDGGRNIVYYDGELIHFRLEGKPEYQPYGTSHLDSLRTTWEVLKRMEDAVMIYRMTRAPERKIFYIPVGANAGSKAIQAINRIKDALKRKPSNSGWDLSSNGDFSNINDVDKRFRFLGVDEDLWIPVPKGSEGAKVETLPAASNLDEIADLEYFRQKVYCGLRIPKAYLQQENDINRATLSQLDVHFARLITRFQESLSEGIEKLCIMQLFAFYSGMSSDPTDITKVKEFLDNYSISLRWTAASFIEENSRYEGMKIKSEIAGEIKNTFGPKSEKFILRKVYQLTPEEEELLLGEDGEEQLEQGEESPTGPEFGEMPTFGGSDHSVGKPGELDTGELSGEEIGGGPEENKGAEPEAPEKTGGETAPEMANESIQPIKKNGNGVKHIRKLIETKLNKKQLKEITIDIPHMTLSPIQMGKGSMLSEAQVNSLCEFAMAKYESKKDFLAFKGTKVGGLLVEQVISYMMTANLAEEYKVDDNIEVTESETVPEPPAE